VRPSSAFAIALAVPLALGAAAQVGGGGAAALPPVAELAAEPSVAAALGRVDAESEALLEAWIRIASTPSSSGQEHARAALVEEEMRRAGLEGVRRDAAGNVVGILPGRDRAAPWTVFMAHMDTVARPGADFTVRREPGRLRGPGVRDDSSGLAALLAAARLARESGVTPPADVVVVGSVEEEVGLRGSRAFLDAEGSRVGAFVAVDGYLGQISYAATGILWMRLHFRAKGAHTLKSHENPSATLAAARAVEAVYAVQAPRQPEDVESWINVGMLGGGEVPNAQARDAWFTVDLRSNDGRTMERLESEILDACRKAAAEVGVGFEVETLQRLEGARIEGHRGSRIVQTARMVLEHLGWRQIALTPRGTADHNVAVQLGIPAIALGVTTGDGAHTPDEFADVAPYTVGVKQLVLLMASPLV
jgi:acetylornithine deacetylase/succinyl-diaminopimelate desuccinylase-like protein